ncbi:MAG: hypothetical protein MUE85_22415 [Microscillaceae bacterium]|jgi:hypothetical protein|nr:hypothetical protein [Microscillaceae bacterium]
MNPQLDKNILLAYLYDELDEKNRQEVETYLATYPTAQAELDELKKTRQILGNLPDKAVKIPKFVFDEPETKLNGKTYALKSSKSGVYAMFGRSFTTIAASLGLVFLLAYLSQLNISYNENELKISFGSPKIEPKINLIEAKKVDNLADKLNKEAVNQLIISYLQKNKDSLNLQISQLESRLASQNKGKMGNELDNKTINLLLEQIRQENLKTMLKITELSAQQQQENVEKMFSSFARYYETQRHEDLQFIGTTINNLQENQQSTLKRQVMTDQILAKLISNK